MDTPKIFDYIKDPEELEACRSDFNDFFDTEGGAKTTAWLNFQHAWLAAMRYVAKREVTQ